jgi:hypothetical protein
MVVEMMQHHRPLGMVMAPPGKCRNFQIQLLDQPLAVRRDDVHAAMANARPVEKRLRSSSETVATSGGMAMRAKKKGGPLRDRPGRFEAAKA